MPVRCQSCLHCGNGIGAFDAPPSHPPGMVSTATGRRPRGACRMRGAWPLRAEQQSQSKQGDESGGVVRILS